MSKPPGNSVLGTLPKEVQAELFKRMSEVVDGRPATTKEALAWLQAEHGVTISEGRANHWYSYYGSTNLLRQSEEAAERFEAWAAEQLPSLSTDQIAEIGQRAFLAVALKDSKPELFATFLNTLAKFKKLELEQRRLVDVDMKRLEMAEAKLAEVKALSESKEPPESVAMKLTKLFAPSAA